jgi:hypothetical protein
MEAVHAVPQSQISQIAQIHGEMVEIHGNPWESSKP